MVIHLDTSVLIEFARTGGGTLAEILILQSRGEAQVAMSTIATFEFFQGKSLDKEGATDKARMLWQEVEKIDVSIQIAEQAAQFIRAGFVVPTEGFDALIAATAVCHHAQLATLNTRHFRHIPNLKLWRSKKMVINDSDWTKSYYA